MGLSTYAKNYMLDELAAIAGWASLHDGASGATGDNEISGGSPAYARIAVVWDPASGAVVAFDGSPVVFDVPAGPVVDGGLWDAPTGGNWLGGDGVTAATFAGQGTYELTAIQVSLT